MKSIYLATDPNCWVRERINTRMLGGAENFFLLLRSWLLKEGYDVYDPVLNFPSVIPDGDSFDLVIHSNSFQPMRGKKHLLWCGSWHCQGHENVDATIMISEFMKEKKGWKEAIVIPAPFADEVLRYERWPVKGRIVTTSNPNRFLPHAVEICKILDKTGIDYEWVICGGNRLYGPRFGEAISFEQYSHPKLHYKGPLTRQELLALLTTAHLWVYPNFSDQSETQCVAIAEAMALKIPSIAPNREPFVSVYPQAALVNDELEAANKIVEYMRVENINYDVQGFSESNVMPYVIHMVRKLLGEN